MKKFWTKIFKKLTCTCFDIFPVHLRWPKFQLTLQGVRDLSRGLWSLRMKKKNHFSFSACCWLRQKQKKSLFKQNKNSLLKGNSIKNKRTSSCMWVEEKTQQHMERARKESTNIKLISLVSNLHFHLPSWFRWFSEKVWKCSRVPPETFYYCAIHMFLAISGIEFDTTTMPVARGVWKRGRERQKTRHNKMCIV